MQPNSSRNVQLAWTRQNQSTIWRIKKAVKRSFDLVVGSGCLLFMAPVMLVIALLVKATSPGPVFYRDERWMRGDRIFKCLKFRTMVVDADKRLCNILRENDDLREEYHKNHKLKNDPRVTPVGRYLRKLSLDELPQLWNVVRGEMSLVGPRPYLEKELVSRPDERQVLLKVSPGITGEWQVNGRADCTFQERLEIEIDYVKNWSFSRDLLILLKTIIAVASNRGAY